MFFGLALWFAKGGNHMSGKNPRKVSKPEYVITPAGPVLKKNVHTVGPDEEVRRNKDGSYSIVPRKPKKG